LKRALLPANSLASWVMIGLAILSCLRVFGLDPSPLLTLGSVSGIVVGFASQNLLLNLISGISIFLTRPFVVGDIVCVKNGAITVAQGTISNISPLRTSFMDDSANTLTLPNKMLGDMVITNFRQQKASLVRFALGQPIPLLYSLPAAQYCCGRKHPAFSLVMLKLRGVWDVTFSRCWPAASLVHLMAHINPAGQS
jgi:Mechanosensitive ion channel